MKKQFCLLIFLILLLPAALSELIEIGSSDIAFVPSASNPKLNIGIEPSFSVFDSFGLPVSSDGLTLNYVSEKIGKAVSLKHQIKPSVIISNWNPSQYYFSIDTNLQNTGQFVEFYTLQPFLVPDKNREKPMRIIQKQVLNHWGFNDKNSIFFDANHVFVGQKLFFNSLSRDFETEFSQGFSVYKITISKGVVSLWFSTTNTAASGFIELGDLITASKSICNGSDENVAWSAANTYFINADANVDIENCQLTVPAGTVVKFKKAAVYLNVTNKGVLKALGTPSNKIVFTSMDDNSVGEKIDASDGVPSKGDYRFAVNFSATAGITADANGVSDLNIGYVDEAIRLQRDFGFISDCNMHDLDVTDLETGFVSVFSGTTLFDFNYNTMRNSVYNGTADPSLFTNSGTIVNFNNNYMFGSIAGAGTDTGIWNSGTIKNFFENDVIGGDFDGCGTICGGTINNFYGNYLFDNGGSITANMGNVFNNTFYKNVIYSVLSVYSLTSVHDNNFTDNTNSAIRLYGSAGDIYNNIFKGNSATNGAGIYVWDEDDMGDCSYYATLSNLYNNLFIGNSATSGAAVFVYTDGDFGDVACAQITNMHNNVFAYNTGTAVVVSDTGLGMYSEISNANNNAFWANDVNSETSGNSVYSEGASTKYLGADPFIATNSDRNFLLNAYGLAQLQGAGDSSIGTNTYFQAKTIRADNRLDYIRSIGYHYDQNAPYLFLFDKIGSFTTNFLIDWNLSSAGANSSVFMDLNILKQTSPDKNVFYLKQNYAFWECSQNLPSLTKDSNCSISLSITQACEDANYLISMHAIDQNGTEYKITTTSFEIPRQLCQLPTTINTQRFFSPEDYREFKTQNTRYVAPADVFSKTDANRYYSDYDFRNKDIQAISGSVFTFAIDFPLTITIIFVVCVVLFIAFFISKKKGIL